jgi:hypothetical protein
VSLLEVLFSIFIILFGLLGVAILLSVGRFNIVEAAKRDRAAACGRASLRDVRARRMLYAGGWVGWYDEAAYSALPRDWATSYYDDSGAVQTLSSPTAPWVFGSGPWQAWRKVLSTEAALDSGAYVIDPLFIAGNLTSSLSVANITDNIGHFPFPADTDASTKPNVIMRRVFLDNSNPAGVAYSLNTQILGTQFGRTFLWSDDQMFPIPTDPQGRPTRLVGQAGVGQSEGKYSWMVTVSPAVAESGQSTGGARKFDVSVVVFCNRDFSSPLSPIDSDKLGERLVKVQFSGGGLGGGDATLVMMDKDTHTGTLDIRENDWILLGGWELLGPTQSRKVFAWYRIVAVEDQDPSTPRQRRVTLSGTDWNTDWKATLDGDSTSYSQGVICTGVIGVYSQMMELQ